MKDGKEEKTETLKMPMALRILRILMIIFEVLIVINGFLSFRSPLGILVATLPFWLIYAMARAIKARKNWPRYVMAAISAISLFACIFPIIGGGMHAGYVQLAIVAAIAAVFCWIPTVILFLPSSNDWFAAKKQSGKINKDKNETKKKSQNSALAKKDISVLKETDDSALNKSDDMVWADEFTLQMGLEFDDLFGILVMPQSFSDAPRMLKVLYGMIDADRSAAGAGCSSEERFNRLHDVMMNCSQREQEALMKFWNFFGEVCARIRNNPSFGREIRTLPKDHYKLMPGVYTHQIMNWACQLMGYW